ncbi:hypothetical protein EDD18DRAFT_1363575 [Armillaria luteobubalina]|uniref:Uncharacterized protein n=1 Tax=Armillaria luteobubalina TaxID=153913 RepID=A0AA39TD12_9AGAR|nr:hypothetical protein EDD18DRAFT_1363575 [Armillaria luteobubalina]
MSIKYYYLHVGLQAKDAFFGDLKQVYLCSLNLTDPFLARSSTKEDEEDCHRRKLRCIEAYLLRMGSLTDGCGLEMLRSAIAFLEEQEAMLHTSTSESLANIVPEPTSDIVTLPHRSTHLLALKDGSSPMKDSVVSLPLPVTPKKSTPVESDYSPTSTIFSPPKFPLHTYAQCKCFRTKDVTEDLSTVSFSLWLTNRPPIPSEWPPHLDSFRDDLALADLYDHNWVLIAPGYINLRPEKELGPHSTPDLVVPKSQPVLLPGIKEMNENEGSLLTSTDANFRLKHL